MRPDTRWRCFRCTARPHRDELWLQAEGEIDLSTSPTLAERLEEALTGGFAAVVLDLSGATFLDSSGLSAILRADTTARELDVGFAVLPGPPQIRRIFEVTSTTHVFLSGITPVVARPRRSP